MNRPVAFNAAMEAFLAGLSLSAAAYLVGSIPSGVVISRLWGGIDPRKVGSGNIGATNVLRAMGPTAAAATLLADAFKGTAAVLAVRLFPGLPLLPVLAGASAILGHNFSLFLGFRGGKGVATTFGALAALQPFLALLCLAVWLAVAVITRYSSAGALAAAAAGPFLALALGTGPALTAFCAGVAGLLILRHRENIARLWAGTERKISLGRSSKTGP